MKLLDAIKGNRVATAVVTVLVVAAVVLVRLSLGVPDITTYAPTPPEPSEVGGELVGPRLVTVDASAPDRWVFFDFSRNSVVEAPGGLDWDIAFRRFRIMTNGGDGFVGQAGLAPLEDVAFDSVSSTSGSAYVVSAKAADSVNPALERWYRYSFTSHLLKPKPTVYALRTADGKYAKFEIVGYYCEGARPGCVTFRYVYQGGGGTDVRN